MTRISEYSRDEDIFVKKDNRHTMQTKCRVVSPEELRDYVTDFMTFVKQLNEMTVQMNKIRDELFQALKEQGIDILRD